MRCYRTRAGLGTVRRLEHARRYSKLQPATAGSSPLRANKMSVLSAPYAVLARYKPSIRHERTRCDEPTARDGHHAWSSSEGPMRTTTLSNRSQSCLISRWRMDELVNELAGRSGGRIAEGQAETRGKGRQEGNQRYCMYGVCGRFQVPNSGPVASCPSTTNDVRSQAEAVLPGLGWAGLRPFSRCGPRRLQVCRTS